MSPLSRVGVPMIAHSHWMENGRLEVVGNPEPIIAFKDGYGMVRHAQWRGWVDKMRKMAVVVKREEFKDGN